MSAAVVTQKPNSLPIPPVQAATFPRAKPSNTSSAAPGSSMATIKSKKESMKAPIPPPSMPTSGPATTRPQTQEQMKKVSRRSSKPIINWFQRKLAGTVRTRRVSDSQRYGAPSPRGKDKQHRRSSVPMAPPLALQPRVRSNTTGSRQNRARSLRGTISLNETDSEDSADSGSFRSASDDGYNLSVARDSLYSPASNLEADEDASVRPLPPSAPPSPSPSRSSSSYLSHSRTFRSMTASTKPTTVLSVDLTGGMAHIAQAPPTPTTTGHRIPPNVRTHSPGLSANSVTFSAILSGSPTYPSRPSSGMSGAMGSRGPTLTAPLYTAHHPRNNPRPSSPPPDDASVLTLASSAFGFPGSRFGMGALTLSGRGSIADDSVSHWSNTAGVTDSTSHFMMGDLEEGLGEERYADHDADASVRALRPRSSRRGSWDSATSGWSANVALPSSAGVPSPGVRSKSMWASGSYRTGGLSTEDGFMGTHNGGEDDLDAGEDTEIDSPTNETNETDSAAPTNPSTVTVDAATVDREAENQAGLDEDLTAVTDRSDKQVVVPHEQTPTPHDQASISYSKVVSETSSPEKASVDERTSNIATPTKPTLELVDTTDAIRHKDEVVSHKLSAPLSPPSSASTTQTQYLSAPSTPAPCD